MYLKSAYSLTFISAISGCPHSKTEFVKLKILSFYYIFVANESVKLENKFTFQDGDWINCHKHYYGHILLLYFIIFLII